MTQKPTRQQKAETRMKQIKPKIISPTDGLLLSFEDQSKDNEPEKIEKVEVEPVSSQPVEVPNERPAPVEAEKKEKVSEKQKQAKEQKVDLKVAKESNDDSKSSLLQELKAKGKKKRIEDTHTRCTYLVRKDLEKRVNVYSEGNFGFKTSFINYAIEAALEDYDKIYNEED